MPLCESNKNGKKKKLIFITGPTAVGKTKISVKVAGRIGGEILSMDSMQIYRGMDVGTAKVREEEMEKIPHHLLDLVSPGERFTAHDYQTIAYETIDQIDSRGHKPIFVGGTGLYLDAVLHDFHFAHINIEPELRKRLGEAYDRDQGQALFHFLKKVDPESARILHQTNRKRILRAMEVYLSTGKSLSDWKKEEKKEERYEALIFVLTDDREKLYERINQRVIQMMEEGLVEENRRLLEEGMPFDAQAALAIGYRQVQWYEKGLVTYEEMVRLIQQYSRNYAKRQVSWIHRYPEAIFFNRSEKSEEQIVEEMEEQINRFYNER